MNFQRRAKKFIFVGFMVLSLASGLFGHWHIAGFLMLGLIVWILFETHARIRFSALVGRPFKEKAWAFAGEIHGVQAWPWSAQTMVVEHGPVLSGLQGSLGPKQWTRSFGEKPLAAAIRPDGLLIWASANELHLCDRLGQDQRCIIFEAPLYRQGYRLFFSADGQIGFLHTPWFVQAFASDLSRLLGRVRYEDAGHYLKYAVASKNGTRLLVAGALLLEENEEGGAGIEARWDAWELGPDSNWQRRWAQACESYTNTHLRGVSMTPSGDLACAEIFREGYQWRLYNAQGQELWQRSGERPVLACEGERLAWEEPTRLVFGDLKTKTETGAYEPQAIIRAKAYQADGSFWCVEGTRLLSLSPKGEILKEAYFLQDPQDLCFGQGFLAMAVGPYAALVRLEGSK